MASLIAHGGHRKELTSASHLVGSEQSADITVRSDLGVAPQHYRIIKVELGWQIEPLTGLEVTSVNGAPIISITPLSHGDQIAAGQLVLTFEDDHAPAVTPTKEPVAAENSTGSAEATGVPAAEATGLADALVLAKQAAPRKAGKRKLPKSATFGVLALLLLGGGGFAAWKMGLFGGSNGQEHFELLAGYAPDGADFAITIDPAGLMNSYTKWQAEFSDLPPLESVLSAPEKAGIDLSSVVRVSAAVKIKAGGRSPLARPPDQLAFVATFDSPFDLGALIEKTGQADMFERIESGRDEPVFKLAKMPGMPDAFLFTEGNSLVVSTVGHEFSKSDSATIADLAARVADQTETLAVAFALPDDIGAALPVQAELPLPESALMSIDIDEGFSFFAKASFADAEAAKTVDAFIKKGIAEASRAMADGGGSDVDPMKAILLRAKHSAEGNSAQAELAFSDAELRMILTPAIRNVTTVKNSSKARRNAQNLTSVWSAAMATGAPDIQGAQSVDDIIQLLSAGVSGGQNFETTLFRIAAMTEGDVQAAKQYLAFNPNGGGLSYISNPAGGAPASGVGAQAASMPPILQKLLGGNRAASSAKKRNAQNLASVFASASAAGSEGFEGVSSAEEAARRLVEGVYGGKSAGFDTILFKVPNLNDSDLQGALEHLAWKASGLTYVEKSGASS